MRHLQSVVWSKGTFLSPQHLQAQDRFFGDLLRFTLDALSFYSWGFSSLQIDGSAIISGQLTVAAAAGFFPDGLPFDNALTDEAPPSRVLDEVFPEAASSCTFFLTVPQRRSGGISIAPTRGAATARFYAELQMLRDENGSGLEKPVAFARRNLRILTESESLEGSTALPLARVLRTDSGRYALDHDFVPPMLDVLASTRLRAILHGLVETLVSRSSQLAGARKERNQSLADFSASDIGNFWLLYAMNTHLPVFRGLLEAPLVHPEQLYTHMLALGGALTTFSRQIGPLDLPRYQHASLGECFSRLEAQIMELLNTVIPSRVIALPLRQLRDSVYGTDIDRDEYLKEARVYLAISAEASTIDLIARTPSLVKACSITHLDTLIRQALPGIPLAHVAAPPREIPIRLNYQYFRLDRVGAAWEAVLRARNFAAYVPDELHNPQLELILVLPSAASS